MLIQFGPDIWLSDGPTVKAALGFCYPTRMVVIRLQEDELFVWSPVALTGDLTNQLAQIGSLSHVVAPNHLHDSFLLEWCAAYPDAQFHAAPHLASTRPDVAFDSTLSDTPNPGWAHALDQIVMPGNAITTEVIFFHRPSGTVLVTDLLQQFPPNWFTGWRRLIAKLDLMIEPEPTVPRKFRLAFRDKPAARLAISKVLSWPAQRVVMAHGTPIDHDAAAFLERAFHWLGGKSS